MAALTQTVSETPKRPDSAAWAFLKHELAYTPDRLSAAARITICAVLITLIGEAARSEALFLALFISMAVPRAHPKQTLQAAVTLIAAIVLSAMAALFLQMLVADLSSVRVLMIFASTFFAMLIGRKLKQPLAGALISVMLTEPLLIYDRSINPEAVVEGILWFVLMFAFGLLTATIIEYLFPHPDALQRLTDGVEQHLKAISATLKRISGEATSDEERRQASTMLQLATGGAAPLRRALADASSAHLLSGKEILRVSSILPSLALLGDLAAQLTPYTKDDLDARQREVAARLSGQTLNLANCLKLLDKAPEGPRPESLVTEGQSGRAAALILSQSAETIEALWKLWYLDSEFPSKTIRQEQKPPRKASFSPQPFLARDSVLFALKVALAAIVCYVLYNAVDWPGISTALVTCYVAALDTIGATYRKLTLRLAGVAIGGLLFGIGGIALFLSNFDNIIQLSLYVAVVFFVAGWIVQGSQRISYAGVQIGLSFALVAMNNPVIPIQIAEARDRLVGVLLGAVVMWFVFRYLWPVDVVTEQRSKVAELMVDVAELLKLVTSQSREGERVSRLHEIRDSANQTISIANDQADSAGYDTRHDPTLQQILRDCLNRTQSLLRLAIIEAEMSMEIATGEEGRTADCDSLATEYASFLSALSDALRTGNRDQLVGLAQKLQELRTRLEPSEVPDEAPGRACNDRNKQALNRIVQQRQADVAALLQSAEQLTAHQEPDMATAKSRFSQRAASNQ